MGIGTGIALTFEGLEASVHRRLSRLLFVWAVAVDHRFVASQSLDVMCRQWMSDCAALRRSCLQCWSCAFGSFETMTAVITFQNGAGPIMTAVIISPCLRIAVGYGWACQVL